MVTRLYLGHDARLPELAAPNQPIGQTHSGALVSPGTGDNMAASLGLDLQPGDVCISTGTSGVASTVSTASAHDGTGMVTGFADTTGRYLPLACTLNGAKVLDFAARQAAWVLSGQALPPAWATQGTPKHYEANPDTNTVARYEELRDKTEGW